MGAHAMMRLSLFLSLLFVLGCPPSLDPKGYTPCASDAECEVGPDGLPRICTEGVCVPSRCGDGKVSSDEECDDANDTNTDECTNGCTLPSCGDGITTIDESQPMEIQEECDDGNESNFDGCTAACRRARCGDGIVRRDLNPIDPYFEECDDGNTVATDACTDRCREARCGDGNIRGDLQEGEEGFEACDDGNSVSTDGCTNSCNLPRCGDGFRQEGEACDDGNQEDGDGCSGRCELPGCGDGVVQAGEACDDGNLIETDNCLNDCVAARCGDGHIKTGAEVCDDGNQINTDACVNCALPRCGDGFVRTDVGQGTPGYEACDDGNQSDADACTSACAEAFCGDGIVREDIQPGRIGYEACDDNNGIQTDACLNNCLEATCGDGIHRQQEGLFPGAVGYEECDDPNFINNDACTNDCETARCGDGIVRRDISRGQEGYEACEDENDNDRDDCTNDCQDAVCGDGIWRQDLQVGQLGFEACDDGEQNNNELADACRQNCLAASCGDRVIDTGEECDDGDEDDRDACLECVTARCGDGIVRLDLADGEAGFEECDDGDRVDNNECNNHCVAPSCGDGQRLGGEECDDGNPDNFDACTNECLNARCGDGILREDLVNPAAEGFESCDEGANNADVADTCRANCLLPRCGDGIVDAGGGGETCDPGEDGDWSDCSRSNCRPPRKRLAVSPEYVCYWPDGATGIHCWGLDDALLPWTEDEEGSDECPDGWGARCYVNRTVEVHPEPGDPAITMPEVADWRSLVPIQHGMCMKTQNQYWCMGNNGQQGGANQIFPGLPGGVMNGSRGSEEWNRVYSYHSSSSHGCAVEQNTEPLMNEGDEPVWGDLEFNCWGDNSVGQLGDGTVDSSEWGTGVMSLEGQIPLEVKTSDSNTCAKTEEGRLWCWGSRNSGIVDSAILCGDNDPRTAVCEPVQIRGLRDVREFWLGNNNACVATGDEARLFCWGAGNSGQLGLAPDSDDLADECGDPNFAEPCLRSPRDMELTGVENLIIDWGYMCAQTNGSVHCWGTDSSGEFGIDLPAMDEEPWGHVLPTNERAVDFEDRRVVEIAGRESTVCALLDDGRVYCWGYNYYGRVGRLGSTVYRSPMFVEVPRGN